MNLDDLKGTVADKAEMSKADASKMISAVFDSIQHALQQGDKVAIPGFGTFEVSDRPARQGRNPQTGATIEIAASKAAKFKAGKGLKDALNG
ncbi:MAG: HU family DNA-binding protein [Geminicoccales bacterium]